ncbi:hypothetical protein GBAR_LOCUS26459 [Geodia barretti]|uniref:Uncharacterized protein n=1 Tax=Geodia barretti TaxID=519541 RepID=A0AA35XCY6_GEOBA|nr:hypothetical protein GBAR_LOCUS26459 [Geodia barretti]
MVLQSLIGRGPGKTLPQLIPPLVDKCSIVSYTGCDSSISVWTVQMYCHSWWILSTNITVTVLTKLCYKYCQIR